MYDIYVVEKVNLCSYYIQFLCYICVFICICISCLNKSKIILQIRTTLTYLGTICLLITGIASFPDECLSKELYCIEPIEYIMNISTNIQNNYFTVSSNILIYNYNEPKAIKLYVGRNCFVHQIHINSLIDNLPSLWGIQTEMLVSTNNRFNIWYVNLVEYIDKGYTKAKRKINFYPGHYRISARYTCFLDKVATVFTYVHQSGEKK